MTLNRHDAMFLRNVIHGAPISTPRLAARLQKIDSALNEGQPLERQFIRDYDYAGVARRMARSRADA